MINQAVILAGGKGKRLFPLTKNLPKPMAPVNGIPFLSYLIQDLKKVGFKKILILIGYKSDVIQKYFNKKFYKNLKISFFFSPVKSDTGRRVIDAYKFLDNEFMLLYGDNYWRPNRTKMYNKFKNFNASITTTVFNNKNGTAEYGKSNNIYLSGKSRVIKYDKTRKQKKLNGVDIGFFIVKKNFLKEFSKNNINYSFENHILDKAIKLKKLYAHRTDKQYYSITNIKMLKKFEKIVKKKNLKYLRNDRIL